MYNELHNLLTESTSKPVVIPYQGGAAANTTWKFTGPTININDAKDSLVFLEASGFGTASPTLDVALFTSFNNSSWFRRSNICLAKSTAHSTAVAVSSLGPYIKLGYKLNFSVCNLRAILYAYKN